MFRFLFPKQAQRIADLEKKNAEWLQRFEELYNHLDVHRDYTCAKDETYELRKGRRTYRSSPWLDLITTSTYPLSFTTTATATVTPPAKKSRKRKGKK